MKKHIILNKQLLISDLQKKHPVFHYDRYSYSLKKSGLEINYYFRTEPDLKFVSKIIINGVRANQLKEVGRNNIEVLIFQLGLVEMLNYWKATSSPRIKIHAGYLNKNQKAWWKKLITLGMGQYFYTNGINFIKNGFINIRADNPNRNDYFKLDNINDKKILVPVGGGKDSSVTLELLRKNDKKWIINGFTLNGDLASKKILKAARIKKTVGCKRIIDPALIRLNNKGYLNGHVPFSAFLAFLSYLSAALTKTKYIVFSNEKSANEGNVEYLKHDINHQWSKTYAFENHFRRYVNKYLSPKIVYFSILRPLYELQIAKIFSRFPQYFSSFLSCNNQRKFTGYGKQDNKWCGVCSKCLFTYVILYPFIDNKTIIRIFKKDLFKDQKLLPIMDELINPKSTKPFECVGTKLESRVAFYLALKKSGKEKDLPLLLSVFKKRYLKKYPHLENEARRLMNSWDNNNNLPDQFIKLISKF